MQKTTQFIKNTFKNATPLKQFSSGKGEHVIGIDLGTTNSCVSVMEGDVARVLENAEGQRTTPSIVAITKDGSVLVGDPARRQAVTNPNNTIYASKRLIGRRFNDPVIQQDLKFLSYKVVNNTNGDAWIEAGGKTHSPSEIGSHVLTKLKATAEEYLQKPVHKAVITVPAYFNDSQRQATKISGQIAGLNVERILNEPTAAALAYGMDKLDKENVIAVYDLGGGTFDISILEIRDGVFEVKATNGDTACGGEDVDSIVANYIMDEFKSINGMDVSKDKMAVQRIREAAEQAKIELSSNTQTEINLPYLTADSTGPKHCKVNITRATLEDLIDAFIKKTIKPCEDCIKDSGFMKADIDDVLLVGGMSRVPKVQKIVQEIFKKTPNKSINPDEAVAQGAAIQGGVLKGDVKGLVMLDVTPLSLGVNVVGGVMSKVIPRNSAIPCKNSKVYTTMADAQTVIDFGVYQGEREMVADNKLLGNFKLGGLPPAPKGMPKIEVTFQIDANGIVNVTAKDKGTGKQTQIQVQSKGGLSQAEIDNMIKNAERYQKEDAIRKELVEVKNEADTTVYSTENSLSEFRSQIGEEAAQEIQKTIDDLKTILAEESLGSADVQRIKDAMENCKQAAMKIGQIINNNNAGGSSNNDDQEQKKQ